MTPTDRDETADHGPEGPPNARYSDGQTAARHEVWVSLCDGELLVHNASGHRLAAWPLAKVRLVDEMTHVGDMRLSHIEVEGARLTVTDGALRRELVAAAPQLSLTKKEASWRWLAYGVLGLAGLGFVIWFAIPGLAVAISQALPKSWEVALGDQVYEQVGDLMALVGDGKRPQVCRRPDGVAALQSMVDRLAAQAEGDYDWRVEIWDSPIVNAFALPGGRIVFFRGLLDQASGPDMVAGVLAHEMGHVTARHGTAGLIEVLGLGFFLGVVLGDIGSGAVVAAGEDLLRRSYSRDAEREADDHALTLLTASGISGQGLADFFVHLEGSERGGKKAPSSEQDGQDDRAIEEGDADSTKSRRLNLPDYLSSHPATSERRGTVEAFVAGHKQKSFTPSLTDQEWDALLAICPPGKKGQAGR